MYRQTMSSPLGQIEIQASEIGVSHVLFVNENGQSITSNESALTQECARQLTQYFSGCRQIFDLPLDASGTDFQVNIWQCLAKIPFGDTRSYGEIASMINNPKSVRAVGGANGKNPISIIVPCHRVIGANGSLTGYAGGIDRKLWLLNHEGIEIQR